MLFFSFTKVQISLYFICDTRYRGNDYKIQMVYLFIDHMELFNACLLQSIQIFP